MPAFLDPIPTKYNWEPDLRPCYFLKQNRVTGQPIMRETRQRTLDDSREEEFHRNNKYAFIPRFFLGLRYNTTKHQSRLPTPLPFYLASSQRHNLCQL